MVINYDLSKISYNGLKDLPDIRINLKRVANSLKSLTKEKTYKANILSGIATNISILQNQHRILKDLWDEERTSSEVM